MRKFLSAVVVVLGALTACTVQNRSLSYDDVYYSPKDKPVVTEQMNRADLQKATSKVEIIADSTALAQNQDPLLQSESRNVKAQQAYGQDQNGVKSATNENYDQYTSSSFNYDDYYDYGYSARIRRFQNGYFGDYYNDYYTNRYWYDMNPGYWGSSIYSSYGFSPYNSYWGNSGFGFEFGFSPYGSFYSSFYGMFDPYFTPYYGYGLGYNYYGGYWGGYGYGGLYGGGYGYGGGGYANNLDYNSRYYGPRRGGSTNGPTSTEKSTQRYGFAAGGSGGGGQIPTSVNGTRNGRETNAVNSGVPIGGQKAAFDAATMPAGQNGREKGGNSNLFSPTGVSNSNARTAVQSVNAPRNANGRTYYSGAQTPNGYSRPVNAPQQGPANPRTYVQQQERYSKPTSSAYPGSTVNSPSRYYKPTTQTYNNPAYSRPRSGNEYTSPGYRSPYDYNSRAAQSVRSVSDPQRYAPPRQQSAAPSSYRSGRESSNYSAPSQSYSSPSPEVRSYSAPSQQSYSAPSQSYSSPSSSSSSPSPSSSRESNSGSGSGGSYNGPRR